MIFISPEWYERVDFEYWKLIMIIYCHHGVISHLVRVPSTLLFAFTKFAKYCHFQTIVTQGYVDRSEWSSYQKKGWESVDFEHWKPNLIVYFHHGVISHFVRVLFTLLFIFTEVAKYCHFQTIVTKVYVDWSEWWHDVTIRDVPEWWLCPKSCSWAIHLSSSFRSTVLPNFSSF